MIKFSANLGFLWTELCLPDAIRAAHKSGFDAVECHWPYNTPTQDVISALSETGLEMLSLNTIRGDTSAGENGLAALFGRECEARAAINQAIDYAVAIGCSSIHVMAGVSNGPKAYKIFADNLRYATDQAAPYGITILIEPLNHYDVPGYFLNSSNQALAIINDVGASNLKLLFDCYHLQIMEGNILQKLAALVDVIGHIQIASVPDRAEPDSGELDYRQVFKQIDELGYRSPIGAEYRPHGTTEDGLGWMQNLRVSVISADETD